MITIDADSLLTQGARKLKDVMLGWHYRSRYESLISFSNAAFYERSLLTIPDQTIPKEGLKEIVVKNSEEGNQNLTYCLDRSISYHFLENGEYQNRTNRPEAEYIAGLIKSFITQNIPLSIGVVAFSQEQQMEIEEALSRLSEQDKEFENRLEEEFQKQADGQFVGLFVKNLENVQGDERDIIIMSVCYGYDHNKRMIMNFGPINRKGGEKRLNVIFSRAKNHMVVVSSIKHTDIKNEYNEGANYFKKFLQYAELVSLGDLKSAGVVLESLSKGNRKIESNNLVSTVVNDIANYLIGLGFQLELNVGQSFFRCHIALKDKEDANKYRLGILIDTDEHYANKDLLEQYVLRPNVLKSFNWNIVQVFTKDWLHQPEKILEQIEKAYHGKFEEVEKVNPVAINQEELEIPKNEVPEMEEKISKPEADAPTNYRKFIFSDNDSNKFWEVTTQANILKVRFGKVNTYGQENVKIFASESEAKMEMEKLILQKTKKGYKPG
jgi:predicted DNA-binding WGR domain protein